MRGLPGGLLSRLVNRLRGRRVAPPTPPPPRPQCTVSHHGECRRSDPYAYLHSSQELEPVIRDENRHYRAQTRPWAGLFATVEHELHSGLSSAVWDTPGVSEGGPSTWIHYRRVFGGQGRVEYRRKNGSHDECIVDSEGLASETGEGTVEEVRVSPCGRWMGFLVGGSTLHLRPLGESLHPSRTFHQVDSFEFLWDGVHNKTAVVFTETLDSNLAKSQV
mgnify:FL=1